LRAWRGFGVVCIAIGLINALVPLLPSTVFLILGAWAYGKGAGAAQSIAQAPPLWCTGAVLA
jgi:uncharacterized membrane protein YbaN (DUF454 family)